MFQQIKSELSSRRNSVRYFTRAWYEMYLKARERFESYQKSGVNMWYQAGNVLLNHAFDPVYESDFYRKNSGAYCEFLEILNAYEH